MKNANKFQKMFFQNTAKDNMTHFNISVTIKRRKENIKLRKCASVQNAKNI